MRKLATLMAVLALTSVAPAQGLGDLTKGKIKLPPGVGPSKVPGGGCATLSGEAGARVEAFIRAAVELEKAAAELEGSVQAACKSMAGELGVSGAGNTKAVCARVAAALKQSLKLKATAKSKTVVTYTPAKCEVKADASARASAACAGGAGGSAGSGGAAGGMGGACQASGEARASLDAQCTPPKMEVSSDSSIAVDASGFDKARRALLVGLPALLQAHVRAQLAAKAAAAFVKSAGGVAKGTAALAKDFGLQAVCVAGRLAGAARGAVRVQASIGVSVSASASVSGAAGARAQ